MSEQDRASLSRRAVVMGAAMTPLITICGAAPNVTAVPKSTALTPDQLKMVEAFAERLIPKDETGPGASECGAANYIDRQLADYLAPEKSSFLESLEATNSYARKSQGKDFVDLSPEMQDAVLTAIEGGTAEGFANSRVFFLRFRRLTLEGTFSDPHYGGNKSFAGWDLIGYPGPRLAVGPEEQKMQTVIKPVRVSAWGRSNDGH